MSRYRAAWVVDSAGRCACGKVRYYTRADARRLAKVRSWGKLGAYRCGDYWHLGHAPAALKRGEIARDQIGSRA